MNVSSVPRRSTTATALFGLLDPIPYGCFVAALIFDIAYLRSAEILWTKGAAWLITFGLLFAVIPRVINLVQVWITRRRSPWPASYAGFWLNLVAIVLAIINAFVHSRDAYAVVPAGMWLSLATVLLLAIAHIAQALRQATAGGPRHE